jgi:putative ATPase
MDLFSNSSTSNQRTDSGAPLAVRMRPQSLEEFIGQEHIVGTNAPLRQMIDKDQITSMIFYGPPGSGKTTLAHIISNVTEAEFVRLNAVDASVKDVREVIDQARERRSFYGRKTILFLDEVHRFNSSRQDALLPAVEAGSIILIGATTENPFHSVNGALLSRSSLFVFKPLTAKHSMIALQRALTDSAKGLGELPLDLEDGALEEIAQMANGDIRRALSLLEFLVLSSPYEGEGRIKITLQRMAETLQMPLRRADESTQYDVLSAFHKSIRGSSDAALYWFTLAVDQLGMDPRTFLRRLIVACSEDIGLANPQAMPQALAAWDAYEKVGWPESRYIVAQAILYAVESPKSNAIPVALSRVQQSIEQHPGAEVPLHLRDTHYQGAAKLGHQGYKYPHDYPGHYVNQQYLPEVMGAPTFYEPTEQGAEAKIRQIQSQRKDRRNP